jgi:MoxR-like ATPase
MIRVMFISDIVLPCDQGCGKSVVAREFAHVFGYSVPRIFPLYRELTARDLLQRRVTDTDGNTTWADSPLIRAAREGA